MIRVYVAGPVGANDAGRRARVDAAITAGRELLERGLAPFVPHLWAGACDADSFAPYESWMAYDFAFLGACDALLRVPGASPGADREVARARELGLRVFTSIDELLAWAGVEREAR